MFLSVCVSCFVSFYLNICKLIAISFFFACAGIDKTSEGNHTVNVFFLMLFLRVSFRLPKFKVLKLITSFRPLIIV